jgi:hypothetical protein
MLAKIDLIQQALSSKLVVTGSDVSVVVVFYKLE